MPDPPEYVTGDAAPQRQGYATLETKPSSIYRDGRRDSGGGYERWRSYEWRPHTSRQSKEDVYVPVHRLCAVAWLLPDDAREDYLRLLDGADVHHTTGVEWANFGESPNFDAPGLALVDHGTHSEITQAQMRAWGEDAKRTGSEPVRPDVDRCGGCGEETDVPCRSHGFEGIRCVECAKRECDGHAIQVGAT